jgi:hypothetical protein
MGGLNIVTILTKKERGKHKYLAAIENKTKGDIFAINVMETFL